MDGCDLNHGTSANCGKVRGAIWGVGGRSVDILSGQRAPEDPEKCRHCANHPPGPWPPSSLYLVLSCARPAVPQQLQGSPCTRRLT